ncbi:hypothetical protein ILP97_05945 [Amycolatopsis sp. H6(2020)]|nr:hypothetical protein [Amycolatopsis sp. H6(2020)]
MSIKSMTAAAAVPSAVLASLFATPSEQASTSDVNGPSGSVSRRPLASRRRHGSAKSLTLAGVVAAGLLGTAVTATAAPGTTSFDPLACTQPVNPVRAGAATVHLFRCADGWHGQITGATPGDEIWVTNASRVVTGWRSVQTGATSANSGSVGTFGSPWQACGKDISAGAIRCTAYN